MVGLELVGLVDLVFFTNVAVAEGVGTQGGDDELDDGLVVLGKGKGL